MNCMAIGVVGRDCSLNRLANVPLDSDSSKNTSFRFRKQRFED